MKSPFHHLIGSPIWALWTFFALSLAATPTYAEEPARPWEKDVSAEARAAADRLFNEGLDRHDELLLAQAAARYREALGHWNHPSIRLNLARVLDKMGQYLEAYQELEKALQWGMEAFDEDRRPAIEDLRTRLLDKHLAAIEVRCDEPGAKVLFDGKPWFVGPGVERRVTLPGEHVVTARKERFFPVVKTVPLVTGKTGAVTIVLDEDGFYYQRPWASWKPWAVVGAGVVAGVIGGGLFWRADGEFAGVNSKSRCPEDDVCPPTSWNGYGRAETLNGAAVTSFVAGGAAITAGLVWAFLNQPRAHRTRPENEPTFNLTPLISRDATGLSLRWSF